MRASRSLPASRDSSMRRARSVTGPLRRAHPASGATWNVQVVRGKMSSKCLWHACRALSAGLLLMLLGAAMAVIGYYAEFLSVDQEVRGNATVSVKDEARGFHLNNLSYVGPIVMGFGGFIVVAACVMTFEARDSAAKVTPARPTAMPRPLPRRGPQCTAPARLDQLGVYRLPHVLPLPHNLPLVPLHKHRPVQVSASAVESECGSQSSLALDLHASGACAGVTLRVRDNTRRRPLARQQRLRDDILLVTPIGSTTNINNAEETATTTVRESATTGGSTRLSVESELRASSAPPPQTRTSPQLSPPPSSKLTLTSPLENPDTCITIDLTEQQIEANNKQEMEKQTDAPRKKGGGDPNDIAGIPRIFVLHMENLNDEEIAMLQEQREIRLREQVLQILVDAQQDNIDPEDEDEVYEGFDNMFNEPDDHYFGPDDEYYEDNDDDEEPARPVTTEWLTEAEEEVEENGASQNLPPISNFEDSWEPDLNTITMHTEQEAERQLEDVDEISTESLIQTQTPPPEV